jgi:hypothetical protein
MKYGSEMLIYAEPPIGIEPMTYALRGACYLSASALPARIARIIALTALAALGLSGEPFYAPFHARSAGARQPATARSLAEGSIGTRERIRPVLFGGAEPGLDVQNPLTGDDQLPGQQVPQARKLGGHRADG